MWTRSSGHGHQQDFGKDQEQEQFQEQVQEWWQEQGQVLEQGQEKEKCMNNLWNVEAGNSHYTVIFTWITLIV